RPSPARRQAACDRGCLARAVPVAPRAVFRGAVAISADGPRYRMNDIYRIDKARVRASFDRAATRYDAAAVLQKEVRTRMLARLDLVKLAPALILDAGCGTGHASHALAGRFADARVVSLDLALGMLR